MNEEKTPTLRYGKLVHKGDFESENHWYPKALNATIHPMINFFLNLSQERIVKRYCHMHPTVDYDSLIGLLNHQPQHFRWAGADLIHVTTESGKKQMVVIENNSCPSGQKSMPLLDDNQEMGGYKVLMERTFRPMLKSKRNPVPSGKLAVIYDKNIMETTGYAAAMAEIFDESVYLVPFYEDDSNPPVKFDKKGVMFIRDIDENWHPVRAAFRYVTQRPWNRLPVNTKTRILNPVVSCLAGGRNKMIAAKAYDLFNGTLQASGLQIVTPETIWNVHKAEIPLWVQRMGGQAVIKIPYSNAGQGVYTIVTQRELDEFMVKDFPYDQFIVQSLIGNYQWSSSSSKGKLYHVGTMPNLKGHSYVADLRMMVSAGSDGIRPICVYARRSRLPLADELTEGNDSWDMLGTNLSLKNEDGSWGSDTTRLMLVDRRDFNKLGVGLDDLIEAYIQTVLSMVAIDNMAKNLIGSKGQFKQRLFKSLNNDKRLIDEILG